MPAPATMAKIDRPSWMTDRQGKTDRLRRKARERLGKHWIELPAGTGPRVLWATAYAAGFGIFADIRQGLLEPHMRRSAVNALRYCRNGIREDRARWRAAGGYLP